MTALTPTIAPRSQITPTEAASAAMPMGSVTSTPCKHEQIPPLSLIILTLTSTLFLDTPYRGSLHGCAYTLSHSRASSYFANSNYTN
jgi:hypothetical protein